MVPGMTNPSHPSDGDLMVAPAKPALRRPSLWQVVLHNDDFTPMDFVVIVLMEIFEMPRKKAEAVMMDIHHKGKGIAGVYSHEIAQTKHLWLQQVAQSEGHPLLSVLERVPGPDES